MGFHFVYTLGHIYEYVIRMYVSNDVDIFWEILSADEQYIIAVFLRHGRTSANNTSG